MLYVNDSFSTLTTIQQVGLLLVSVVLLGLTLWGAHYAMKDKNLGLRLVIAALIFFCFLWLSPQIYYAYYQILWPDLPWQMIIKDPPSLSYMFELVTFSGRSTTSWHARGVVGVSLLILAIVPVIKKIVTNKTSDSCC